MSCTGFFGNWPEVDKCFSAGEALFYPPRDQDPKRKRGISGYCYVLQLKCVRVFWHPPNRMPLRKSPGFGSQFPALTTMQRASARAACCC
jgi:hypothetical protein